jgi:hypothetical protein
MLMPVDWLCMVWRDEWNRVGTKALGWMESYLDGKRTIFEALAETDLRLN